MIVEERIEEIG